MTFKSILLGSAAVMAVTGAQAADLSVAEPVDYVRVCDAFGAGYWYIPGSDTCIKLGGRARFTANFMATGPVAVGHTGNWTFSTNGMVNVTAKSMTEYGVLTGFVEMEGTWANPLVAVPGGAVGPNGNVGLGDVYLQIGPVTAGAISSVYEYGGWLNNVLGAGIDGLGRTDVVQLHWAMNGFGLALEIGDPRDNWNSLIGNYSLPQLAGAISFSGSNFDAELSAGYATGSAANSWGVQGGVTFNLDSIAAGDQLRLKGQFGGGTAATNSWVANLGPGAQWAVEGSFLHNFGNGLAFAVGGALLNGGAWNASGDVIWTGISGLKVAASANITSTNVATFALRGERTW